MASYRRHATTPYAVARAKRYLRRHIRETPPSHHGGPCQSYVPTKEVAAMLAAFTHRLEEMVPVVDVPLPEVVCGWNPATTSTDCDWDATCPVHGGES